MSQSLTKVINALSETRLSSGIKYSIIQNVINEMSRESRRMINVSSLITNWAPFLKYFKTFSRMSNEERGQWLNTIKPGSFIDVLVNDLLMFMTTALFFLDEDNAKTINYDRSPLKPIGIVTQAPKLSSANRPKEMYDVIIIGSGAGGAVVAWELARRGLSVAVFETGLEPTPDDLRKPPVLRTIKFYWNNGLTTTYGNTIISLPFGKVLGGTTTVNSGTMFRITDQVLSKWSKETGVNIPMSQLEDAYKIVEEKLHIRPVPEELLGNNALIMRRGAEALGLSHGPIRRPLGTCYGQGECAFVCPHGGKLDMRFTFLSEAKNYGAEIFTSSHVIKVIIRNNKAVGVLVNFNGSLLEVRAKVIVVSAGAISSPRILRNSGVRNRNLGKHLHIHPAVGVVGKMNYDVYGWKGTMQSYYVDSLLKDGILLEATFPPPGIGYSEASPSLYGEFRNLNKLATIGIQNDDSFSEGYVFPNPLHKAMGAVADYDLNREDLERIKRGIELTSEILFAAGAERVYLPLRKNDLARDMAEVKRVLSSINDPKLFKLSAYHPMSSARMGKDPDAGVIDAEGRVFGIDNLYVVDASSLPSSTGGINPQLTINAISLMIAQRIAKDFGV
ncbi:MAG: GMC family oxidoreductase N-terminal domain-containing protein [Vulcanisaeta sp.]|uniref:GMC family oxidoreductase N-terminal domain-containing protein n=1 Tax=Vulcanisaeta sp. TaxID=2020871 RepID=UPI003D0B93E5